MMISTASALSRPNDFQALFIGNPSPAVTVFRRSEGPSRAEREPPSPQRMTTVMAESLRAKIDQFIQALVDAHELSAAMTAEEEIAPIDVHTLRFAIQSLAPLITALKLPPPLMLPLQNGGIGAEWHTSGLNIELRFRKPYEVYAVLEDARNVISAYHGRDPYLVRARPVLSALSARASE